MMRGKWSFGTIAGVGAIAMALAMGTLPAQASGDADQPKPPRQSWSFSGPFGTYDTAQLQRGFQVYREVCSACHSMKLVAFRNLADPGGPGFSQAQVKALAADYKIKDGPNEAGDMYERPGRTADYFPSPFPNENAARAANGGAAPPDFSVLAKARTYSRGFPWFLTDAVTQYQEHGVDYIVALLNGYVDPPADVTLRPGQNYNLYMPGHLISMAQPLVKDGVTYSDGSPQTVSQYAKDVAAFMMWAAEPKLNERKRIGLQVMVFLLIFGALMFAVKKKVVAGAPH